jgi:hypothetical protein
MVMADSFLLEFMQRRERIVSAMVEVCPQL